MICRVLKRSDGGVSIIHPAPKSRKSNETEAEWLDRVLTKATPPGVNFEDIDSSDLPKDRDDRHAWEFDSNSKKVKVNQAKKQAKDQEKAAKEQLKESAKNKIKASAGLSDEEIEALNLK